VGVLVLGLTGDETVREHHREDLVSAPDTPRRRTVRPRRTEVSGG
jgi:hypothetical protein